MAKISDLPAASALTGAETLPIVQGGVTRNVPFAAVLDAAAEAAKAWAQTIGPEAWVNIENPVAGTSYIAAFSISNALAFTRFRAKVTGSGSAQVAVIANGVVFGPVNVDDDGLSSTISITVPANTDIYFSIPTGGITGTVTAIYARIDGDAA